MSQFSYSDYTNIVARAQSATSPSPRIGFFKLPNDGDEALVRINCGSVDALEFASVHTVNAGGNKWLKVSCLNPLGAHGGKCPLCNASNEGMTTISKASKKVYLQMLVSYKDKATGSWSAAQPVIWERPASFSREIANKLRDYGDLRQVLLKITRNGQAGDMKTTYSIDYAVPTIFKPDMIPADFSAFSNFNIAKHSYWEKTADEMTEFITTGAFPEVVRQTSTSQSQATTSYVQPQQTVQQVVQPVQQQVYVQEPLPESLTNPQTTETVVPTQSVNPTPVQQPQTSSEPTRNFSGRTFSF